MNVLLGAMRLDIVALTTVLEILVLGIVTYQLLVRLGRSPSRETLIGLFLAVFALVIARSAGFGTAAYVWDNLLPYGGIAIIVLFQSEIRAALARLGKSAVGSFGFFRLSEHDAFDVVEEVAHTIARLRLGGLIVVERDVPLNAHIESGVCIDGLLSYDLLLSIFVRNGPLHDGAVIIRRNRIAAAACVLPLSVKPVPSRQLGTRHRAAIGITEETDALAIAISEESGAISVSRYGLLESGLSRNELGRRLRASGSARTELVPPLGTEVPTRGA